VALESTVIEKWMQSLFSDDPTISGRIGDRIYLHVATQTAVRPYMVISFMQGEDYNGLGERGVAQPLYFVRTIGMRENLADMRAVADRADDLLQDTHVTADGYRINVKREEMQRVPEFNDGVEYQAIGGMYRCRASLLT
jgi:hypothetical protein